ncbi:MAG: hypothetical protein JHC26_12705 [Thermofilum sp.]|jgi:hypothetical protein|uniref:hypothetical protein n=1 Tax=Thermofilum sp. TaxID=1961369 RepID=UPI002584B93A|nr:hypothetical protein [Thermofilum sp.]MCI4409946.1 hypothetical protein [Thermofilum sp.]
MPRKSAINRGTAKFQKLYLRILNTVKAQFPNAPDEVIAEHAAQAVYKYATALGLYEGEWRGFKAFMASKNLLKSYRNEMGPLRSAVIHLVRLRMTGADDEQLRNAIESLSFDLEIKKLLKEYFGVQ